MLPNVVPENTIGLNAVNEAVDATAITLVLTVVEDAETVIRLDEILNVVAS